MKLSSIKILYPDTHHILPNVSCLLMNIIVVFRSIPAWLQTDGRSEQLEGKKSTEKSHFR